MNGTNKKTTKLTTENKKSYNKKLHILQQKTTNLTTKNTNLTTKNYKSIQTIAIIAIE